MKAAIFLAVAMAAGVAFSQDAETLGVEFLSGRTIESATWCWGTDAGGLRSEPVGVAVTKADARAITNAPAFLAWLADRQAQATRPRIEPTGIEIQAGGLLVLQSATNAAGWAYVALDDGQLVSVGPVHGSPWKTPAEIAALVSAKRAAHYQAQAQYHATEAATAAALAVANASPNSLPALKAVVSNLVNQVNALKAAQ